MPEEDLVRALDAAECRELLRAGSLGRLAVSAAGQTDIFPVNYASDGESILIRTAPGTKLLELTIHDAVAFEIDGYDAEEAWSVVAHGHARQLELGSEIDAADALGFASWMPAPKDRYVQIDIATLTGLRFRRESRRSAEPPRE